MANLHVMVGIPGSGKSQLARTWFDSGFVDNIVSSDDIREEVTGDAGDVSQDAEVWGRFHERIASAIRSERTVVADATHVTRKSWKAYEEYAVTMQDDYLYNIFKTLEKTGKAAPPKNLVNCYAHFVIPGAQGHHSSLDICWMRNQGRERVVPGWIMHRMTDNWKDIVLYSAELHDKQWQIVWHYT